jgi:hypothetical protein
MNQYVWKDLKIFLPHQIIFLKIVIFLSSIACHTDLIDANKNGKYKNKYINISAAAITIKYIPFTLYKTDK